jgi:hypothetical protein
MHQDAVHHQQVHRQADNVADVDRRLAVEQPGFYGTRPSAASRRGWACRLPVLLGRICGPADLLRKPNGTHKVLEARVRA